MEKTKKDYIPVSMRMSSQIYQRLCNYCEESGQPKTVAVERAITMFIDDYDKKQQILAEHMPE